MKEDIVKLRVYDLSKGLAKQLAPSLGLDIEGIWHTSVEVFQKEYYFQDGIISMAPGSTHHGEPLKVIEIGKTTLTVGIFDEYIESIQHKYNRLTYNLMLNNCNHFSNDAALFLCSNAIPDYILHLPDIVMRSPVYQAFLVKLYESHEKKEDENL